MCAGMGMGTEGVRWDRRHILEYKYECYTHIHTDRHARQPTNTPGAKKAM